MKQLRQKTKTRDIITVLLLLIMVFSLTGCIRNRGIKVVPRSSYNTLDLSPPDIVKVMRTAGFTDQQIREHGIAVHDGINRMGAAYVYIDENVEATFIANGNELFITTMTRGLFIYNVETGYFVTGATQ